MALTNSQYDSIIRIYDYERMNNKRILDERREYVYSHVNGFKELDEAIIDASVESARKRIAGNADPCDDLHEKIDSYKKQKAELLRNAGISEDYLDPIYTCPDCKDTGYIDGSKCHCFIKRETDILYDRSNIRDFIKNNNFSLLTYEYHSGESLEQLKNAVSRLKDLIDNFENDKKSFLLYGTVGTGKSFLSGCVAKELIEKGYNCIYYSSVSLFETIAKGTFHPENGDRADLYNLYDYLYNCDLLIVDDLGTENINSFVASKLFALLNERIIRQKSTIISTNLSLEQIRDIYSDRIFSRIVNSFEIIKLTGDDIRIRKTIAQRK